MMNSHSILDSTVRTLELNLARSEGVNKKFLKIKISKCFKTVNKLQTHASDKSLCQIIQYQINSFREC